VPCVELPLATPFTDQLSTALPLVPVIVAVKTFVPLSGMLALVALSATAIESVTVTLAVFDLVESVTLATMMTAGLGLGTFTGGAL
jgi:hypothetical protein